MSTRSLRPCRACGPRARLRASTRPGQPWFPMVFREGMSRPMAGSQKDPVHRHGPRARPTESHTQQPVLTRTQTPCSCITIPAGEPEGLAQGTTAGTAPALRELLPEPPPNPLRALSTPWCLGPAAHLCWSCQVKLRSGCSHSWASTKRSSWSVEKVAREPFTRWQVCAASQ